MFQGVDGDMKNMDQKVDMVMMLVVLAIALIILRGDIGSSGVSDKKGQSRRFQHHLQRHLKGRKTMQRRSERQQR